MAISAQQIKELREKTGAGVSDIKRALEDSGGDMIKALAEIEKKLGSSASKKSSRETKAGLVESYVHGNGKIGALVEVLCETDFVARNPEFKELAHNLAMQIAAMSPTDENAFLEQSFIKDQGKTIRDILNEAVGKFGENIKVGKFTRLEV